MSFNGDYIKWLSSVIVVLLIAFIYFLKSYNSIFTSDYAFIYHPESGQLYEIELDVSITKFDKWQPFIPFASLYHGDPVNANLVGGFDSLIEKKDSYQQMDREEKSEAVIIWLENTLEASFSEDYYSVKHLDINYYPRKDIEPEKLLPKVLYDLKVYSNQIPAKLLTIDFVVREWSVGSETNNIKIFHKGLLIRGIAAHKLVETLLPIRYLLESF